MLYNWKTNTWFLHKYIFYITLELFPIFKFESFGFLFGSQMSFSKMGFKIDLFNPVYFESNLVSVKCQFIYVFWSFVLSAICPFGDISFRSDVFRPYVRSAVCLSFICPITVRSNSMSQIFLLLTPGT